MPGKLYFVPTPVGNLADMSNRALDVLSNVDVILAEDTRTTGVLLKHFNIEAHLLSHHKFNEHTSLMNIIDRLLEGQNIALVSDAGTPGISDPGFLLSRECRKFEIPVETLPGPTAFVPALVNSGLPTDRFCFEGFLPQKNGRQSRIQQISTECRTSVIYESPLRLVKTLTELSEKCGGERNASVSREISKLHEETIRGTLNELVKHFTEHPPKGEIVIVLAGTEENKTKKIHKNKYKDL